MWATLRVATSMTRTTWSSSSVAIIRLPFAVKSASPVMPFHDADRSRCSGSPGTNLDDGVYRLGVLPAHQVGDAGIDRNAEVGPGGG